MKCNHKLQLWSHYWCKHKQVHTGDASSPSRPKFQTNFTLSRSNVVVIFSVPEPECHCGAALPKAETISDISTSCKHTASYSHRLFFATRRVEPGDRHDTTKWKHMKCAAPTKPWMNGDCMRSRNLRRHKNGRQLSPIRAVIEIRVQW